MRVVHLVRKILGTVIAVLCFGAALYGLFKTMQYGSCASGGTYVSSRACSPDSGWWNLMIFGGIPAGLLGLGIGYIKGFGPDPKPAVPAVPAFHAAPPMIVMPGAGDRPASMPWLHAPVPEQNPLQRLERLTALRDSGALTPAEFERGKAALLTDL